MKTTARNVLAVVAGVLAGSVVNMGLVELGPMIIPLPAGADTSTAEGLKASMDLFTPAHFVFPFLAHALGTLVGAFVAARLATGSRMKFGLGIGVFYLLGGIAAVVMFGGPVWFMVLDLVGAYIPMGYLGGWAAERSTRTQGS